MFEDNINYEFCDAVFETSFSSDVSKQHRDSPQKNDPLCSATTKICNIGSPAIDKENLEAHTYVANDFVQTENSLEICNRPIKRFNSDPLVERTHSKKTKSDFCNNSSNIRSPIVVKRELPGPAGLLHGVNANNSTQEVFLCSQQTFSTFEKAPWQEMVTDFQDSHRELLFEKFNISWIKAHFCQKKQMVKYKAPFLACTVDSVESTGEKLSPVEILLRDKTGTIQGTILHSLYEEFCDFFTVGSVLVLLQFGVLEENGNHFLTITPNNLLTIYHTKRSTEKTTCDNQSVKKIVVQQYTIDDIWKKHLESVTFSLPIKRVVNFKNLYTNTSSLRRNQFTNVNIPMVKMDTLHNAKCKINLGDNESCIKNNYSNQSEVGPKSKPSNLDANNVNLTISSSQISVKTDKAHSQIWEDLFQEVDTDALFDDF